MLETNELDQKIRTLLHPRAALIAYARKTTVIMYMTTLFHRDQGYRRKRNNGRRPPVTAGFHERLVTGYSESHSDHTIRKDTANLLWCDPRKGKREDTLVQSPTKRMMFFKEALKIENAEYHLPGVIYEAGEHVNASMPTRQGSRRKRRTLCRTVLQRDRASVCLGSARIEQAEDLTYENCCEYWERKFWLTEFSHWERRQPDQIKPRAGDESGKDRLSTSTN